MKKIQKCLLALLVVAMVAGALVACGDGNTTTAGKADPKPTSTAPITTAPGTTAAPTEPAFVGYYFTVVYEDTNAPVEGAMVQLCQGDSFCLMPKATGADGKVEYSLSGNERGVYDIHILEDSIPAGYTFDATAYKTNADEQEYTLILKKKECEHNYVNDLCILCGKAKIYPHVVEVLYDSYVQDETMQGKGIAGLSLLITSETQMIASGVTDENGKFTFEAAKYSAPDGISGYQVIVQGGVPEGYVIYIEPSFLANALTCKIEYYDEKVIEANTAFNPGAVTAGQPFHLVMNEKREDDCFEGETSIDHMFHTSEDESLYYVSFHPTRVEDVGHYKLTVSGAPEGVRVYVGHYPSSTTYIAATADISAVGENPTLEFNVDAQYLQDSTGAWSFSNSWLFGIRVEGEAAYPMELDITVTWERELIEGQDYDKVDRVVEQIPEGTKSASEILGDITGKTLTVITKKEAEAMVLVLGEDGCYHVGSADGPVLLVNLCKANPLFGDENEETVTFINVNAVSGTETLKVSYEVGERHYKVHYYADMLKAYGALCGEDGYYPVNAQLYTFLHDWTAQNVGEMFKEELDDDHAFLICCGYYA